MKEKEPLTLFCGKDGTQSKDVSTPVCYLRCVFSYEYLPVTNLPSS